jgi:flagellar hook-basal body complex protein FliE
MSGITPIGNALEGVYNRPELPRPQQLAKTEESDPVGEIFTGLIDSANDLQSQAASMEETLYSNDPVELHRVMIAAEEAGVATDLVLQIRNRLVEGFQTLMRLPV